MCFRHTHGAYLTISYYSGAVKIYRLPKKTHVAKFGSEFFVSLDLYLVLKPKKKLKYLVASTHSYFPKTLPLILPSLLANNIKINDILITIGNCKENIQYNNFRTYCVPYNSFEYAPLINLIDIGYNESEYVFLLHDTMLCGVNFGHLSRDFAIGPPVILAHKWGWTNMGAYNVDYLYKIKDKLQSLKTIDKRQGILAEGKFFDCQPTFYKNPTSINHFKEMTDMYGTGRKRVVDYYNSVDVIKFGANGAGTLQSGKFINEL